MALQLFYPRVPTPRQRRNDRIVNALLAFALLLFSASFLLRTGILTWHAVSALPQPQPQQASYCAPGPGEPSFPRFQPCSLRIADQVWPL